MTFTAGQLDSLRVHDTAYLAPNVRRRVVQVLHAVPDAACFETLRLQCLQTAYYASGASKQLNVLKSSHGYGLAADLVHLVHGLPAWDYSDPWWSKTLGPSIEAAGLTWGGRWHSPNDPPHAQTAAWAGVVPDDAAVMLAEQGISALWAKYDQ